ncbi:HAD family hydrolase [Vibrio hepatarius]|jgi:phosphoglycolate phosphatase-like HAD superfamily hydrolase|uniref:Phosphatase n=1 Tax=Vibrio hepatarius TaxID=171383 RepID=A0A0M0I3Z2_9VIBR|nr:HAD-IA family hydrolase [Vibrio hepatarius]KOO09030.1 phosphatase [Vibrio hepatarius]
MSYVPLNISHLKAIVFDLDNTLVTSDMDFTWLREQLGCPLSSDLLSYVEQLECQQAREKAHSVILEHELHDARTSQPMPGCLSLLDFIQRKRLLTAVITRNCAEATQQKIAHNQLNIPRIITREHFPPKPSPDSLLALAQEWQLQRHQILYVGDFLYDLQAAFNADMPSCLVTHGKKVPFSNQASLVVEHLHDLEEIITKQLV